MRKIKNRYINIALIFTLILCSNQAAYGRHGFDLRSGLMFSKDRKEKSTERIGGAQDLASNVDIKPNSDATRDATQITQKTTSIEVPPGINYISLKGNPEKYDLLFYRVYKAYGDTFAEIFTIVGEAEEKILKTYKLESDGKWKNILSYVKVRNARDLKYAFNALKERESEGIPNNPNALKRGPYKNFPLYRICLQLGIKLPSAKSQKKCSLYQKIKRASKNKDYYKVLGLPITASLGEIKKRYRKLAQLFHSDKQSLLGEEMIKSLNEAYEVLGDPEKREKYDRIMVNGISPELVRRVAKYLEDPDKAEDFFDIIPGQKARLLKISIETIAIAVKAYPASIPWAIEKYNADLEKHGFRPIILPVNNSLLADNHTEASEADLLEETINALPVFKNEWEALQKIYSLKTDDATALLFEDFTYDHMVRTFFEAGKLPKTKLGQAKHLAGAYDFYLRKDIKPHIDKVKTCKDTWAALEAIKQLKSDDETADLFKKWGYSSLTKALVIAGKLSRTKMQQRLAGAYDFYLRKDIKPHIDKIENSEDSWTALENAKSLKREPETASLFKEWSHSSLMGVFAVAGKLHKDRLQEVQRLAGAYDLYLRKDKKTHEYIIKPHIDKVKTCKDTWAALEAIKQLKSDDETADLFKKWGYVSLMQLFAVTNRLANRDDLEQGQRLGAAVEYYDRRGEVFRDLFKMSYLRLGSERKRLLLGEIAKWDYKTYPTLEDLKEINMFIKSLLAPEYKDYFPYLKDVEKPLTEQRFLSKITLRYYLFVSLSQMLSQGFSFESNAAKDASDGFLKPGLRLLDIGTAKGILLHDISKRNPKAEHLVGIDLGIKDVACYMREGVKIELRPGRIDDKNWNSLAEGGYYDIAVISYPDTSKIEKLWSLLHLAMHAVKCNEGMVYVVADTLSLAEEIKIYMEQMFFDVDIAVLPEDWPISEYTIDNYSRTNHHLVLGRKGAEGEKAIPDINVILEQAKKTSDGV